MEVSLKNIIRSVIWKIIGTDPRYEYGIDMVLPRKEMLNYAVALIDHQTRLTRLQQKPGERGSLLGDYLEFGCYGGDSFIYAYKCAGRLMPWMKFYAFDSFQGLPEPKGADKKGPFWQGQFTCSQEDFMNNLKNAGIDLSCIECIPGWFNETLSPELKKRLNLSIASIVYIDCDLYESCLPVLKFITDIVETGSIIIFDDWFSFRADPMLGIQRACREWLSENPGITLQDWHPFGAYGKSFVVNIK